MSMPPQGEPEPAAGFGTGSGARFRNRSPNQLRIFERQHQGYCARLLVSHAGDASVSFLSSVTFSGCSLTGAIA
jgi:hypothetical protein